MHPDLNREGYKKLFYQGVPDIIFFGSFQNFIAKPGKLPANQIFSVNTSGNYNSGLLSLCLCYRNQPDILTTIVFTREDTVHKSDTWLQRGHPLRIDYDSDTDPVLRSKDN